VKGDVGVNQELFATIECAKRDRDISAGADDQALHVSADRQLSGTDN